jgi:hypothetical protein
MKPEKSEREARPGFRVRGFGKCHSGFFLLAIAYCCPNGGFGFAYILCFYPKSGGSDLNCDFFFDRTTALLAQSDQHVSYKHSNAQHNQTL